LLVGPYASLNHESLMSENEWLDGIVTGSVEETVLDYLDKGAVEAVSGGIWRKNKSLSTNKIRHAAIPFREMPWPARDIEEQEKCSYINMEFSRGCGFSCSFCHNPIMSRCNSAISQNQARSAEDVVGEIESLNARLKKSLFIFNDECFWRGKIDNGRVLDFCRLIKEKNLKIKFYIYLRCRPFPDQALLSELKEAGLSRVFIGLENISSNTQKVFKKEILASEFGEIKKDFVI
jgi:radical SAM superfamily enzyme YgiQ (UPF0313 family)